MCHLVPDSVYVGVSVPLSQTRQRRAASVGGWKEADELPRPLPSYHGESAGLVEAPGPAGYFRWHCESLLLAERFGAFSCQGDLSSVAWAEASTTSGEKTQTVIYINGTRSF